MGPLLTSVGVYKVLVGKVALGGVSSGADDRLVLLLGLVMLVHEVIDLSCRQQSAPLQFRTGGWLERALPESVHRLLIQVLPPQAGAQAKVGKLKMRRREIPRPLRLPDQFLVERDRLHPLARILGNIGAFQAKQKISRILRR